MIVVDVDGFTFSFPDGWQVARFDKWRFYDSSPAFKQSCGGCKGVDLLAIDPGPTLLWIIEVKDYRVHPRRKKMTLDREVALKVRDTLAALVVAQASAAEMAERDFARAAVTCPRLRVVLHLETPVPGSPLFAHVPNPANVALRLRQDLRVIDPNPLVLSRASTAGVAWNVA